MTISLRAELREAIRDAAGRSGQSVSTWVTQAAEAKLRNEVLSEALDEWQAEHGIIAEARIAAAEIELGLRASTPR